MDENGDTSKNRVPEGPYEKDKEEIFKITLRKMSVALEALPLGVPIGAIDLSDVPPTSGPGTGGLSGSGSGVNLNNSSGSNNSNQPNSGVSSANTEVEVITQQQIVALAGAIPKNGMVKRLKFNGSKVTSPTAAIALVLLPFRCSSLEDLDLSARAFRSKDSKVDGVGYIMKMEKRKENPWEHREVLRSIELSFTFSQLQFLDLSYNSLGYQAFSFLAKGIEYNTTLIYLKLSNNPSAFAGTPLIASAISKNSQLRKLVYRQNDVDVEGALALSNMLTRNFTLTSLSLRHNPRSTFQQQKVITAFEEALRSNPTLTELDFPTVPEGLKTLLNRNRTTRRHLKEWSTLNEGLFAPSSAEGKIISPRTAERIMGGPDFFSLFFTALHRHTTNRPDGKSPGGGSNVGGQRKGSVPEKPRSSSIENKPEDNHRLILVRVALPAELPRAFFASTSVLDWRLVTKLVLSSNGITEFVIPPPLALAHSGSSGSMEKPSLSSSLSDKERNSLSSGSVGGSVGGPSDNPQPSPSSTSNTLRSLATLSITYNTLKKLEGLSQLPMLSKLELDSNQLSELPSEFSALNRLRSLRVTNNLLSSFPEALKTLNFLEELDLSKNQITYIPSSVSNCSSLTRLAVAFNKLVAVSPQIALCSNLKSLDIRWNFLHYLPVELIHLTRLENLQIRGNPLESLSADPAIRNTDGSPQPVLQVLLQVVQQAENFAYVPITIFTDSQLGKHRLSLWLKSGKKKEVASPELCPLVLEDWFDGDTLFRAWDFLVDDVTRSYLQFGFSPSPNSVYILYYYIGEESFRKIESDLKLLTSLSSPDKMPRIFIVTVAHQQEPDLRMSKKAIETAVSTMKKRFSAYSVSRYYALNSSTGKGIGESRSFAHLQRKLVSIAKKKRRGQIPPNLLFLNRFFNRRMRFLLGSNSMLAGLVGYSPESSKEKSSNSSSEDDIEEVVIHAPTDLPFLSMTALKHVLNSFNIPESEHSVALSFLSECRTLLLFPNDLLLKDIIFYEPKHFALLFGVIAKINEVFSGKGFATQKDLTMLWNVFQIPESLHKHILELIVKMGCGVFSSNIPFQQELKESRSELGANNAFRSSAGGKPSPMRRVSSMPHAALAKFKKPGYTGDSSPTTPTKESKSPVIPPIGLPRKASNEMVLSKPVLVPSSSPPLSAVQSPPAQNSGLLIPVLFPKARPDLQKCWPLLENCHETTHVFSCKFLSLAYFGRCVLHLLSLPRATLSAFWRTGVLITHAGLSQETDPNNTKGTPSPPTSPLAKSLEGSNIKSSSGSSIENSGRFSRSNSEKRSHARRNRSSKSLRSELRDSSSSFILSGNSSPSSGSSLCLSSSAVTPSSSSPSSSSSSSSSDSSSSGTPKQTRPRAMIEFEPDKYEVVLQIRIPKRKKESSEFSNQLFEALSSILKSWGDVTINTVTAAKRVETPRKDKEKNVSNKEEGTEKEEKEKDKEKGKDKEKDKDDTSSRRKSRIKKE